MEREDLDAEFSAGAAVPDRERRLVSLVYVLQAVGLFIGFTLVVGVIINYVKRGDVAGTWLAEHHRWQIRSFWYYLLWAILGWVATVVLVGYVILLAAGVWLIYRIVKGWLYLRDGRDPYAAAA